MGIFKNLLKGKEQTDKVYSSYRGESYTNNYSQYNPINNIFDLDITNQCINKIVSEICKITPLHILQNNNSLVAVNSNVQRVLNNPNKQQTTYDFLSKVVYNLITKDNSFIFPVYDGDKLAEFLPLKPNNVEFLENNNNLYIKMTFNSGYQYTFDYNSIIHIRKNYYEEELVGYTNPAPLLNNIKLNSSILNSLNKNAESIQQINGIVKYGSLIAKEKLEEDLRRFEEDLKNNKSGILAMDMASDYIPITKDVKMIDKETLDYLQNLVLNHFNTNIEIINNTASKEQYELWYNSCILPLLISMGQAFTKTLFTERERSFGNKIEFYNKNKLFFMNGGELNTAIEILSDLGTLTKNEIRAVYGLQPLTEEEGGSSIIMSLNYIDSKNAEKYQLKEDKDE